MTLCGIQDGFTQDASAVGEAYIPDFSPGNLKNVSVCIYILENLFYTIARKVKASAQL